MSLPVFRFSIRQCLGLLLVLVAVMPAGAETPLRQAIDTEIQAAWTREKVTPTGIADDSTFLRRVYLDLLGTIPTHDEAVQFLKSNESDKRAKLIDRLLADPRYASQQATIWARVLLGKRRGGDEKDRGPLTTWLEKQFAGNVPYDRWARDILLADGKETGPEKFLLQYRGRPEETAMTVSRIFLGTQLQCTQCHDDRRGGNLTQKDFYAFAAFFVRLTAVDGTEGGKPRTWIAEKNVGEMMFSGPAAEQVPGKKGTAVPARFLGGDALKEPELPKELKEQPVVKGGKKGGVKKDGPPEPPFFSRRQKLVEWLAVRENPYFARAVVNRVWAQFMGRGLVHQVDDLRERNPATHPVLLDKLTEEFMAHAFDMKWLIREIVSSQSYQRAPSAGKADPDWFEFARTRALTGDEMMNVLREATGFDAIIRAKGEKPASVKVPNNLDNYIVSQVPDAPSEGGDYQASLQERLFFDNSARFRDLVQPRKGNLADALVTSSAPWEERIDRLFLTVLSRPPRPREKQLFVAHFASDTKAAPALVEEAIWTLVNTSEFRFNR